VKLLQQRSRLRVAIQLQQRDDEQITNTLIVVGIEAQQLAIVRQRFVVAAEASQSLCKPEPGPHVGPRAEPSAARSPPYIPASPRSKKPQLEPVDELTARIREASRIVPLERLALSPQCGFAATREGNRLTADDQRLKLELVARTAGEIWTSH
jgi:hypothetical protein